MEFTEIDLKGAYVIKSIPAIDNRGFFGRWFCQNEFTERGLHTCFVQCNQSGTYGIGSIRGMHFQYPPHAEVKLVKCISGKIFDVIIDLRYKSRTYLRWFGVVLSAENKAMLYIPKGFAHGFQTLTEEAEIIYMVSDFYNKDAEGGIFYNDPAVKIQWPIALNKISEKDNCIPMINNSFKGIAL